MKQEPRFFLAIFLTFAILMFFYGMQKSSKEIFVETKMPLVSKEALETAEVRILTEEDKKVVPVTGINMSDFNFRGEDKNIVVENDKVRLTLSTRGAQLTSYELKEYHVTTEEGSPFKDLLKETQDSSALFLGLKGYLYFDGDKLFKITSDKMLENGAREIKLTWQDQNLVLDRTFLFGGLSPYRIDQYYEITNRTSQAMPVTPFLQKSLHQKKIVKESGLLSFLKFSQPDYFGSMYLKAEDDGVESQLTWDKLKPETVSENVSWSGMTDRYFLLATFQKDSATKTENLSYEKQDDFLIWKSIQESQIVPPQGKISGGFTSFIGPKKFAALDALEARLGKAIDYGWFGWVAYPILWLMTLFHKIVPNWGLVIILLTFVVKMLLHPVNKKSLSSMKAMQQLQPKIKEIKNKYKDDRQKQHQEVMQLFRTHKVNPMGGCLPMLLQMPIYIALYKVLWNAIELYHVPFLFYADLSAPDPYFIAPVLLGVFMFFQQKLTPNPSADDSQRKIMMIMPLMFAVFMIFLPVGLVIYIFVNTTMSVAQQFMLQRDLSFKDLITGKWQPNGAQ